jgi:heme exporter protein D
MTPAFSSVSAFFAMGGYAFYVWLAVVTTIVTLGLLTGHTLWQRRWILNDVRRQQLREHRFHKARTSELMNKENTDAGAP